MNTYSKIKTYRFKIKNYKKNIMCVELQIVAQLKCLSN